MSRTIACLKTLHRATTIKLATNSNIKVLSIRAHHVSSLNFVHSKCLQNRVLGFVVKSRSNGLKEIGAEISYKGSIFNPCNKRAFSSSGELKDVVVPQLAESLSEGDLKLDKGVGDAVAEDEVIGAIETDKTSVPVHSPAAGVITEILAQDGDTVKPGQTILKIQLGAGGAAGEASKTTASSSSPPQETRQERPNEQQQQQPQPQPQQQQQHQGKPQVQPIDSTPKSTIPVSQIKSELASSSPATSEAEQTTPGARTISSVKMNRMRLKIASRLKEAQNTYAMLTTFNEIDMSNLIEMRLKYKDAFAKKHSVKLGFMSAFVKASAYALKDQPVVNAVIDANQILYRDFIDISVAVATPKGLVVPVLRNVDIMNFADIEKAINALGEKARNNTLSVEDMDGGTFTISNGGVFGSLFGTPIINSPQSAILGMHAINDKPAAVNGEIKIRPIMVVALTYDHRLIDGREAVTFLKKIKEVIEDPRVILLDL